MLGAFDLMTGAIRSPGGECRSQEGGRRTAWQRYFDAPGRTYRGGCIAIGRLSLSVAFPCLACSQRSGKRFITAYVLSGSKVEAHRGPVSSGPDGCTSLESDGLAEPGASSIIGFPHFDGGSMAAGGAPFTLGRAEQPLVVSGVSSASNAMTSISFISARAGRR